MTDVHIAVAGNWAVADDGIQWILQRYQGDRWRNVSFVRSPKDVLARCLREAGAMPDEATALLDRLPDRHQTWPESGSSRLNPKALPRAAKTPAAKRLPMTFGDFTVGPDHKWPGMYRVRMIRERFPDYYDEGEARAA
jgi:hypothetical protein